MDQKGVFKRAVKAIKAAQDAGFQVNVNATIFDNMSAEQVAAYLDYCTDMGVSITISPGYAYERAPDQEHFLERRRTKELFRDVFRMGEERVKAGKTKWDLNHSSLYLDFLAGNQQYMCTPWGMPTRNIFGWQRPCYLLNEGYASSFKELMEETEWDQYGTGNYEKCADCMAHCGYEPTAAADAAAHPLKTLMVSLRGPKTKGDFAPEIDLTNQRRAKYIHDELVQKKMEEEERLKDLHDAKKGRDEVSGTAA